MKLLDRFLRAWRTRIALNAAPKTMQAVLDIGCGDGYAATFGLYALALQKVPLSLAQPVITGGASVVTAMLSVMLLKESMGFTNWLGLLLVCAGVYLLFYGRT